MKSLSVYKASINTLKDIVVREIYTFQIKKANLKFAFFYYFLIFVSPPAPLAKS